MDHLGDLVWSSSADPSATKKHLPPSNPASPPTTSPQIINKPSPTPARSNMPTHLLPNMFKQQQQPQQQQPTPSYVVNSNIRRPMSPLAAQQPSNSSPTKPADPFGNLLSFGSSSGKSSPSGSAAGRTLEEQRLAKEAELKKNRSDDMLKGFGNLAAMDLNSNSAGISRSGSPSANVLSATQQNHFSSSSSASSTPASPNTQFFPQSYRPANTPPPPTSSTKPITAGKPQPDDAFSGLINPTPMRAKLEKEKERLDRLDGASLNQLRTKSPSPLMPSQSNVPPERTSPKEKGSASSPWDLDYLAAPKPIYADSALNQAEKKQVGDDSFDLGIFEKAVADMTPETDASLTTRPISITKDPSSKQPTSTSTTAATTSADHMVAQMVDMGYDVSAAQAALAASGNQSVLAAIELITQQREQLQSNAQRPSKPDQSQNEPRSDLSHPSSPSTSPTMARRKFSYKDDDGNYRDPSASSSSPPLFRRHPAQRTNDTDQFDANMFNRDKLLAHANFLKKSVLAKASTLVKQGQTKVKAAVSEVQHQLRELDEGAGRSRADGRPRWMNESTSHQDAGTEDAVTLEVGSFRDDEEDERGRQSQQKQQISPNQPHGAVGATSPTTRSKSQPQPQPQSVPNRAVFPKRPVVACVPNVMQEMETHKTKGNEFYKLGQFGAADESYSVAISLLPAKHQLLIPLHSNRALARLKTGDHPGARDDATLALELIGEDYLRGADEIGPGGEGVVFADMYTKARIRRAQAFEGMEKYDEALKDYREVMAFSPGEKTVSTSMGRCQKAIQLERTGETARSTKDGGETSVGTSGGGGEAKKISPQDELLAMFEDSPSTSRPQSHVPQAKPAPLRAELDPFALGGETSSSSGGATKGYGHTTKQDIESSARVASMRAADAQTEQEDNERILLKESVDARINLWKGRKENNIRALLASLDTVLWPEMEWKPVGMHELVSPGNVKIKYMKAIGKVHPDKLTSVSAEQHLIAQDVFNALNEAYNAFKSQNNP